MNFMFWRCSSLKELNLDNFYINNETDIDSMFLECSDELIMKIKTQYQNIKKKDF